MKKEDIKRVLANYGFTISEVQIDAVYEVLQQTNLAESQQYEIVNKYGQEALIGVINTAVENNIKKEDEL